MVNKFLHISIYSTILFCVVSFLSLTFSMIYSRLYNITPNFEFGFPFEIYYQFELRGECNEMTLLHGAHFINIIYNLIFCFIATILFLNFKQKNNINPTHP